MPTKPGFNYVDDRESFHRFVVWLELALLLMAALALVGALLGGVRELPRYLYMSSLVLLAGASHLLLVRRGPEAAMAVMAASLWLIISLNIVQYAGIHSASIILYPFLIGLAGWVLGRRWLLGLSGASVIWLSMVGWSEHMGWLAPTPRAATPLVTLQIVAVLMVSAGLIHAAQRSLANSRDRALQLSAALAAQHAEVLQREHELMQLMNRVPAGVASFDVESRVRRCNVRYAALFDQQPEQLIGRPVREFVPPEALIQIDPTWERAIAGQQGQYRRSHRDPLTGQLEWLDVSLMPDINEQGQPVGVFALLIDVTARVQAEREVLALNAELAQRVEQRSGELAETTEKLEDTRRELEQAQARSTLSVLVAKMSHELASPVGNSRLLADTFLHWIRDFEQQMADGQLRKSALLKLLKDLSEGSRQMQLNLAAADELMRHFKQISADQASGQRRRFDLAEMVRELATSLAPTVKRSGHQLKLQIPAGLVMDSLPGPLGQVLINLINNALLHAFEGRSGGEVLVSAEPLPDSQSLRLTVSDNGNGIPPALLPELFKPFFSTKIGAGGTGLGLSIVEDIVRKRLGGTVSVNSSLGRGTSFELSLPLTLPFA